jgi:hypothetical protein
MLRRILEASKRELLTVEGLMNDAQAKTNSRALGLEDETDYPLQYDGLRRAIDLKYLGRGASMEEIDGHLGIFNSYEARKRYACLCVPRPHVGVWRSSWHGATPATTPGFIVRISPNCCVVHSPRSHLPEVLGPDELSFYTELPDWVPIWRGCERRRERGLRGQLMELLRNGISYVAYVLSFQEGRESPQEGRWMRLPSGRQAENDGLAWLRRAAAARDRLRLAHA